jgi:glycosyltransferase involved in cell wall biosynthesis
MNNQQVLELMSTCHLNLLPTLHDTYGFSVLEGFANGLPAITTDIVRSARVRPSLSLRQTPTAFLLHLPKR